MGLWGWPDLLFIVYSSNALVVAYIHWFSAPLQLHLTLPRDFPMDCFCSVVQITSSVPELDRAAHVD